MNSSNQLYCAMCGRRLDESGQPDSMDCGGDCLRCVADTGDPDAQRMMLEIDPEYGLE